MKPVFSFFLGMFAAAETILLWVILSNGFNIEFLTSTVSAFLVGGLTFFGIKLYSDRKFLKKNKLTRKEYVYIQKNLTEAKRKISRLQKAFFFCQDDGCF